MSSNPAVTIGVTAVDKASGVLKSLDSQVAGTTSKIEQSGAKAASVTDKSSGKIVKSYANIAGSIASLGAGIVSFATSFSTLEKAQNRVDTTNLSLQKSQAALEKLQTSGTASAEKLALAQEDMRVKSDQLRISQGDLADTTANFYAQIPSQIISFGTSAALAFSTYSAGAKGATGATTTLGHSFKVAMLGPPPIGLILTGVGIAATLVATHFDEISGALQYAGKVVHEFLTVHFKPLADLIDWFIDGLNALGAGLNTGVTPAYGEASEATGEFANETVNAGNAVVKTTKELQTYNTFLQDLQDETIKSTRESFWLIQSLDEQTSALVRNANEIDLVAGFLQDQQRELERTSQENFALVASVDSVDQALQALRDGSLTLVADKLRELQDEAKETTKDLDDLNKKTGGKSIFERALSAGLIGTVGKGFSSVTESSGRLITVERHASGGLINEPTMMLGLRSGRLGLAGERGSEEIIPHGRRGRGRGDLHLHFEFNKREFAKAIVGDIGEMITRNRTIHMRITHEAIHGTM